MFVHKDLKLFHADTSYLVVNDWFDLRLMPLCVYMYIIRNSNVAVIRVIFQNEIGWIFQEYLPAKILLLISQTAFVAKHFIRFYVHVRIQLSVVDIQRFSFQESK